MSMQKNEMKTAIVGAGPAGVALARLLKLRGEPFKIYDKPMETTCGLKSCAWGMRMVKFEEYCGRLGLNPGDYCLRQSSSVRIQGIHFKCALVIVNKPKLLGDLISGIEVIPEEFGGHDRFGRVIDATGTGAIDGNHDFHLTYQIRAKGNVSEPTVYVDPEDSRSFLWLFPLGDGTIHVGVMTLLGYKRPDMAQVSRLLEHFKFDIGSVQCACDSRVWAGGIREPLVLGNVWRIGESGGFVDPISGAGLAPAFQTALMAEENWNNPDAYANAAKGLFAYMDSGAKLVRAFVGDASLRYSDMLGYLGHREFKGISLTPLSLLLLAFRSRAFRKFALSFTFAFFGNRREMGEVVR